MKKTFLILIVCCMAVSCKYPGEGTGGRIYMESFVTGYYPYTEIELSTKEDYLLVKAGVDWEKRYGILSKDEESKEKYRVKCTKHNDFGYNQYYYHTLAIIPPHDFQDRDFRIIEITSDADYDPAHAAGTSLNDLFYFASASPINYIRRGYTEMFDWRSACLPDYYYNFTGRANIPQNTGLEPVYGLLSEISEENMVLLGNPQFFWNHTIMALTPVKKPETAQVHNFTVRLTDTDGQVLSATVRAEFE